MPFKVKNDYNFIHEAGVYMFCVRQHTSGKFALGSAIHFERRLLDHLNSFRGHRIMQQLHQFAQINGGLQSFTWSPLITCPNYKLLYNKLYPSTIFVEKENQILTALTQFQPRIFEQSYLSFYNPVLNGTKNGSYSVIFSLTSTTQIDKTKNKKGVRLFQALDENNLIVASSNSLAGAGLASKLGISYAGVNYHLNRESWVYAKSLDLEVNVKKDGVETISESKDLLLPRYKSKLSRENLNLIETSINSLEKGYIFVYALDKKTIICLPKDNQQLLQYLNILILN